MVWWLFLAIFLFVVCAVLLVFEIFVPSFGLLTLCALAAVAGGVSLFFKYGTVAGWIGVGISAVIIPVVWVVVYRIFPNTRFGRSVTLGKPDREKGDAIPDSDKLAALLDKVGVVSTPLRPVGMCDFSGDRVECLAETGYIEKDSKVRVIDVEGMQLTVRKIEEN